MRETDEKYVQILDGLKENGADDVLVVVGGTIPGSVVLSGEMMLRYLGWTEAAELILKGLNGAIASKRVTYDFARQMEGATQITCSQFGDNA